MRSTLDCRILHGLRQLLEQLRQAQARLTGDACQIVEFILFAGNAIAARLLAADRPPWAVGLADAALQRRPAAAVLPHAERCRVAQEYVQHSLPLFREAQCAQQYAGCLLYTSDAADD